MASIEDLLIQQQSQPAFHNMVILEDPDGNKKKIPSDLFIAQQLVQLNKQIATLLDLVSPHTHELPPTEADVVGSEETDETKDPALD